jgi:transposase-like protein
MRKPTIHIQWKGTDVCTDIVCPNCGQYYHFDGYFLYSFKCSKCGKVYEVPVEIPIKEIDESSDWYENAVVLQPEEDDE